MDRAEKDHRVPMPFGRISQVDLPQGRNGKHKNIVVRLLAELEHLPAGEALKIPFSDLPDSKENIRSALNRATTKLGLVVSTSSDEEHFYLWKPE